MHDYSFFYLETQNVQSKIFGITRMSL